MLYDEHDGEVTDNELKEGSIALYIFYRYISNNYVKISLPRSELYGFDNKFFKKENIKSTIPLKNLLTTIALTMKKNF